jgi:hypothetical protein
VVAAAPLGGVERLVGGGVEVGVAGHRAVPLGDAERAGDRHLEVAVAVVEAGDGLAEALG